MIIFKQYEQLVNSMLSMSKDMRKLTLIIADQQKQIRTLTSCVEQLQDLMLDELEKDL